MTGRICLECDDGHLVDTDRLCLFCGSETLALDDYHERQWYAQEAAKMSEPPLTVLQLEHQAWQQREALRHGWIE